MAKWNRKYKVAIIFTFTDFKGRISRNVTICNSDETTKVVEAAKRASTEIISHEVVALWDKKEIEIWEK